MGGPGDPEATLREGGAQPAAGLPAGASRYAIVEEIGRGSSGRVLLARDAVFGRDVAMKLASGADAAARVLREARLTARLEHSNVVPVHDLEQRPDGSAAFTMRRIVGHSLGEALRRRAAGEAAPEIAATGDIVTIFRKACDAVGLAHEQGLVHRDLKPDNLMLGRHGEVFVVDWGEAIDLRADGPVPGGVSGTPAYMAPEQARGEPAGPGSDVYALGASLFHGLFGRHPLHPGEDGLAGLLTRRARGDIDPPDPAETATVPLPLQAIVLRALAARPEDRPADAEALGRELGDWQTGRLDAWDPVVALRFSDGDALDPRFTALWSDEQHPDAFPCPERVVLRERLLEIGGYPHRTFLRWTGPLSEETRFEAEVEAPEAGINLDLCVCGDPLTGYRLRIVGRDQVTIETVHHGRQQVLARWGERLPVGRRLRLAIAHADNRVWAELDGRTILACSEPLPPRGTAHRTVAVGRLGDPFACRLAALRLWTRRPPLTVGVLDVGKQLLRAGHGEDALAWFRSCLHQGQPPAILQEAAFLVALSAAGATRETALRAVAGDAGSAFRLPARHLLAQEAVEGGDAITGIDHLLAAERETADPGMCSRLASLLVGRLQREPEAGRPHLLAALARIPLRELDLPHAGLADLAPLAGMRLERLGAGGNRIADLAPLAGMPLQRLDLPDNAVAELAALATMPLQRLDLRRNPCRTLPALPAARLQELDLAGTGIADLGPLAGQPLRRLDIRDTPVRDLAPLAGAPLAELNAQRCPVADLAPLAGAPFADGDFADSAVADPAPLVQPALRTLGLARCPVQRLPRLAGCSLARLDLAGTRVADLAPLVGASVRALDLVGVPAGDLAPLAGLGLEDLAIDGGGRDWSAMAGAPLATLRLHGAIAPAVLRIVRSLRLHRLHLDLVHPEAWELVDAGAGLETVNGLDAAYVRRLAPALRQALAGDAEGLRAHAVPAGDRFLLPLPQRLTRAQALALAEAAGAILLCLPDAQRVHEAHRALLPLAAEILPAGRFHGGVVLDAGTPRWADGSPLGVDRSRLARELAVPGSIPVLCLHQRAVWVQPDEMLLPVLEWTG